MKTKIVLILISITLSLFILSTHLMAGASVEYYLSKGAMALKIDDLQEAEKMFQQAIVQSPGNFTIYYKIGVKYFDSGHYQDAINYFKTSCQYFPADPSIRYRLGLAYLKNGNPNAAIDALEFARKNESYRAYASYFLGVAHYNQRNYTATKRYLEPVEQFPEKFRGAALYYAGKASLYLREYQQAEMLLHKIADLPPPANDSEASQRANIIETSQKALKTLERIRRMWGFKVAISSGYDSNVLQLADDREIDPSLGISNRSDYFTNLNALGNLKLINTKHNELMGVYKIIGQWYNEVEMYDYLSNSASVVWTHFFAKFTSHIKYLYENLDYNHIDFAEYHNFETNMTIYFKQRMPTSIYFKYRDIDRFDDDASSGHRNYIGILHGIPLWKNLNIYFTYEFNEADTKGNPMEGSDNFDSTGHYFAASLSAPIFNKYKANASLNTVFTNYDNIDSRFPTENKRRKEKLIRLSFSLARVMNEYLQLQLSYGYENNNANIDAFEYSKGKVTFGLIAQY